MTTETEVRRKRRKNRNRPPRVSVLAAIAAVLVLVVIVVVARLRNESRNSAGETTADTAETVEIAGQQVAVDTTIEKSNYTASDFSVDTKGRVTYSGEGATYGIDVAAYQGEIDWAAVKADGIDFAIIRAGFRGSTAGDLYTDECFAANIQGAQDAGVDVGVYFFSQAVTEDEAVEEAKYVLSLISDYSVTYPVFFDWEPSEDAEGRTYDFDYDSIGPIAEAFCKTIVNAGYKSGIYFNSVQGYLHYDLGDFSDVNLWLADYGTTPDFYYNFNYWQYSNTGTVDGIDSEVDLDICFENLS